eukprot:SAG31_NODE_1040_length_10203_cov_3.045428_6_plen_43_part_00
MLSQSQAMSQAGGAHNETVVHLATSGIAGCDQLARCAMQIYD